MNWASSTHHLLNGARPTKRFGHTAVVFGRHMFIFGGLENERFGTYSDGEMWVVDLDCGRCHKARTRGQAPTSREAHSAVVIDNCMYVFGGYGPRGRLNDAWRLNLDLHTWTPLHSTYSPPRRNDHSAVAIDYSMYIFGGFGGIQETRSNDTWRYDTRIQSWEQIFASSQPPPPRSAHSSVAVGDDIILFGGWDSQDKELNDLWCFNSRSQLWTSLPVEGERPSPRSSHRAVLQNDKILIYGGYGSWDRENDDLYSLDIQSKKFERILLDTSGAPTPRAYHSAVTLDNKMYIYGGRDQDGNALNSMWSLNIGNSAQADSTSEKRMYRRRSEMRIQLKKEDSRSSIRSGDAFTDRFSSDTDMGDLLDDDDSMSHILDQTLRVVSPDQRNIHLSRGFTEPSLLPRQGRLLKRDSSSTTVVTEGTPETPHGIEKNYNSGGEDEARRRSEQSENLEIDFLREENSRMRALLERARTVISVMITDPVKRTQFVQPVVASDGYSYEQDHLIDLMRNQGPVVSPLSGMPFPSSLITPNNHLLTCLPMAETLQSDMNNVLRVNKN